MRLNVSNLMIWAISALFVSAAYAAPENNRIYVDAKGTDASPDGSSWSKAYSSLQDALNDAASTATDDDIWIAEGTYKPEKRYEPDGNLGGQHYIGAPLTTPDRMKTFELPDGVNLYGGFEAGAKSLKKKRNLVAHETVLDGDIGALGDSTDNSWHVLIAGDDVNETGVRASLHTLTIKNGSAEGPIPVQGSGFGNADFRYRHDYGGAMFINFNSELLIEQVKFVDNWANGDGGALFYMNSNVTIADSHFEGNASGFRGGAIEAFSIEDEVLANTGVSTMVISGTNFINNKVGPYVPPPGFPVAAFALGPFGGAIVAEGSFASQDSSMTIEGCYFEGNQALEGGAIVVDSLNVDINNTVFFDNYAEANAGALAMTSVVEAFAELGFDPPFAKSLYTTTVTDSVFDENHADGDNTGLNILFAGFGVQFASGGGAVVNYMRGVLDIDSSLFTHNYTLVGEGGAILNGDAQVPFFIWSVEAKVTNSVFRGNSATDGGAIASNSLNGLASDFFDFKFTLLDLSNSLFIGNTATDRGGSLYLKGTEAQVNGNLFAGGNTAGTAGDEIYANESEVDGTASSDAALEGELISGNLSLTPAEMSLQ
jgi:predicted outer membrane repeat protein